MSKWWSQSCLTSRRPSASMETLRERGATASIPSHICPSVGPCSLSKNAVPDLGQTAFGRRDVEWRTVEKFPDYEVSETGLVCSTKSGARRLLKPIPRKGSGHLYVFLYDGHGRSRKFYVHALVLTAFLGPCPQGQVCRHLDGNSANNDKNNLCWGTYLQNSRDTQDHGHQLRGEHAKSHKLTAEQVMEIRRIHGTRPLRDIARDYGVSHTAIRRAALGIKWAYLEAQT